MTRREPGPPTRWFGLETIRRLKSDQLGFYADMQARYGDTVRLRIGPHVVWLFFHPDSIDCVLRERADDFVRFEPVMRVLEQWNGESLLTVEGERWQQRRRLVVPSLGTTRVSDYGERILEATARTIERWRAVGQGEPLTVETDREMASLSLRVAASTLFDVTLEEEAGTLGDAVADLSEVAFQESLSPFRRPLWLPGALSARKRTAALLLNGAARLNVAQQ